jgi:23S rRNA-intervening sequence protein
VHHLSVAYGSLMEVETQTLLAERPGYLTSEQSAALSTRISEVARLLSGLIGALQRYRQARERERRRIREGPPPASGRDAHRTQDVLYLR